MNKTFEQILKSVDEKIEKPLISAKFSDNWKTYAKNQIETGQWDIDTLIDLAWKNGRKAILLEREIQLLVLAQENRSKQSYLSGYDDGWKDRFETAKKDNEKK